MKTNYLLTVVLCFGLATGAMAQKAEELQNSYNYKRALEILQNDGDQNEALDYLNKEITEHPKNGYAYYMMGNLYNNANTVELFGAITNQQASSFIRDMYALKEKLKYEDNPRIKVIINLFL